MVNHLATGKLGELIKAMPPLLRQRLNEEIAQLDRERLAARQPGEPKVFTLANHLRWMIEQKSNTEVMKLCLYGVLIKYLPINLEQMLANKLPSLSDCTFFWGLRIKELEKESTKTNSISV